MLELNKFTKNMQAMLPQWMTMAKKPESVGAQFLNVFGLEFGDVQAYLDDYLKNTFIDSVDLSKIDICYKVPISVGTLMNMESIDSVLIKKGERTYASSIENRLRDFYRPINEVSYSIIDEQEQVLYVRPIDEILIGSVEHPFDEIIVNGVSHFEYSLHHVWNTMDEFGLLLGIYRLYGERNVDFKNRILDVFVNPANATKNGLLNGLARELGIQKEAIVLNELNNRAFRNSLLNADGSPSKRLVEISGKINQLLGFTWDNMSWDEAYWYSIEDNNLGLEYLPHVWDASTANWGDDDFQSGIGDGSDLLVSAPVEQEDERKFKYTVGLRGRKKGTELISPEMSFHYKITAKGMIESESYKAHSYKYTIIASEIIPLYLIIRAFKQYQHTTIVDFDTTKMNFRYDNNSDPSMEIQKGNESLEPKNNGYLKIHARLETSSKSLTPILDELTIKWEDTTGAINQTVLTSGTDFDGNGTSIQTNKINVITRETGVIELGYGDFYYGIDSKEDWQQGYHENTKVSKEGYLTLIELKQ